MKRPKASTSPVIWRASRVKDEAAEAATPAALRARLSALCEMRDYYCLDEDRARVEQIDFLIAMRVGELMAAEASPMLH